MEFVDASENAHVARCGHFSLRGYVVEIRKKDRKRCWPFSVADCPNGLEQQGHKLPALDATEFRWWGCPDCVRTLNGSAVTGEITNHCNDEYESISHSRKNVVLYGDAHNVYEPINHENARRSSDEDAPIQVSVPPRASREDNCEERNDNLSVSTGLIHEAADTQEIITNHSNNGHEPISHSQEIVAMSSHGYVLNLQPITGYSDENTPRSSDGVAPVQLSVPPRASREDICEERYDDLCENTDLMYEAAETQETTNPSNNGHKPISHSQEIVVLSPHGYASNLVPITSHSNENAPISSGDAPMQLTGSPRTSRTDISEERNDKFNAIMNLNEVEKENLSLGDDMEPATDQPRREAYLCPFKGQGDDNGVEQSVNQAVQKTTGAATTEMPCPTERTTDGFNATIMSTNNNMQESNGNVHNSDTLDMCASGDENASETVSHNKKSKKEKRKRMRGSASESYLEENLGFGRKKVVKMKKGFNKTSGRKRSMVNLDKDENAEEFSETEHDNPSGISRPRKVQKVRTMKDILSSKTAVASSKSSVFSEDLNTDETNIEVVQSDGGRAGPMHKAPTHCGVWGGSDVQSEEVRKEIVGVDLNLYLDSAMTVRGFDDISSDKRKRPVVQGGPLNNDEMVSSSKRKNKVPRVEDERSRFMTWKEGSGFQIAKDDMQNTVLQLGGGNVVQAEHSGPQFYKSGASCLPRGSADIMYEPVTSDEMEVVALLAKHRHERRRSDAEGANRNSSDGYVSRPSKVIPTVSLSQPNHVPFGMNNHQRFVSGSRNVTRPSQPLERPPEKVIQRERELKYHQKSVGQLGLPANYVIPETDFLRLMVNSLCTSTSANVDRRHNFGQRPLLPREHQPQHQHKNGETSMRPVMWKFFDKSPEIQSQKTKSRIPKLMFDAFKSQAKVPTKRKKAGPPQSRKSRLEKSVPGNANSSERLQIVEKLPSVPAPMTFGTQRQPIHSATPHRLDLSRTAGTEICPLNRNPADFSLPEKGNKYMLGYRELKPKKTASAGNKRRRMFMNVQ